MGTVDGYTIGHIAAVLVSLEDLLAYTPRTEMPTERQCLRMDLLLALKTRPDIHGKVRSMMYGNWTERTRRAMAVDLARVLVPIMNSLADYI